MYNIVATKQGKTFFPKQNTMPQLRHQFKIFRRAIMYFVRNTNTSLVLKYQMLFGMTEDNILTTHT